MVLKIVHFNEPILRKKGARVTAFNATLAKLARTVQLRDNIAHPWHSGRGALNELDTRFDRAPLHRRPVPRDAGF